METVTFSFPASEIDQEYWDLMERLAMMRPTTTGFSMSEIMQEFAKLPLFQAHLLRQHGDQISSVLRAAYSLPGEFKLIGDDGSLYARVPITCTGYSAVRPGFYDAHFEVKEPRLAMVLKLMSQPDLEAAP